MANLFKLRDTHKLIHLHATIERFTAYGLGNCFQRSVAMVLDAPRSRVVIGTLRHRDEEPYLHCWVEEGGWYYDPAKFEELGGLPAHDKSSYTQTNSVTDIHVVARPIILTFAKRGALSRWMLSKDESVYHKLGGIMGEELMRESGIPFRVEMNGALKPAIQS